MRIAWLFLWLVLVAPAWSQTLAQPVYKPVPQPPPGFHPAGPLNRVVALFTVYPNATIRVRLLGSSGYPAFDRAVLATLRTWRWRPALDANGTPITSDTRIKVSFDSP